MNVAMIIAVTKVLHQFILDILFPVLCLSCKKEGAWLCDVCQSRIKIKDEHNCPICEKMITPDGRTCLNCKNLAHPPRWRTSQQTRKNHLDGLVVASSYQQAPITNAVHLFKYRFVSDLHVPLGNLLVRVLQKTELPLPDMIIPVPLHPRRLRWRGFNQSQLLAKHLAKNLLPDIDLEMRADILARNRYTAPQMGINDYKSRQKNITNAFAINPDADIKNKIILLVDDIATTGSTIFECAKILKAAGASEVFAIVIARQETKAGGR